MACRVWDCCARCPALRLLTPAWHVRPEPGAVWGCWVPTASLPAGRELKPQRSIRETALVSVELNDRQKDISLGEEGKGTPGLEPVFGPVEKPALTGRLFRNVLCVPRT